MRPAFSWLCPVVLISFLANSFVTMARAENYARICVTTIESESKELPLTETSSPAPAKKLVIHLDANMECTALIVPFTNKGSSLANDWRPQMVTLPQWDERTLPNSRAAWEWNKDIGPFELWIFFFKRDVSGVSDIQKLVTAMQTPTLDEKILTQQTRRLCDMLASRMTGNQPRIQEHKATVALVGGTVRGTEFPWRDFADKVPLNDALEGTLVIRHGR